MPRLKQPVALQKLSFDFLVGYIVDYCDSLSIKGLLTELYQAVAVFKHHVRDHMPSILFAEFCSIFLSKFCSIGYGRSEKRPASHYKAALEIMMDVNAVGLMCRGEIVQYLDPGNAHRIQGLKILDWKILQHNPHHVSMGLENYSLQDLTTFIFPRYCTDRDLEIIGSRCSKLQVLMLGGSGKVTDRGLRALRSCSELRTINVSNCLVSNVGVNELLNFHKKLEKFNVGNCVAILHEDFDVLSRPISLVCPSVKSFALKSGPVSNRHLDSVVKLFPNLTYLEICRQCTGDLRILKDLKSLTELTFNHAARFDMENLEELLTSIGANISRLVLECAVCVTQNDLNSIFQSCGNLERFCMYHVPSSSSDKLIIPPFQKLKRFDCIVNIGFGFHPELEFGQMPSLESFMIPGICGILEITESMMLDNVKFPNLREVRTYYDPDADSDRIMQIARDKNLDFSLLSLRKNYH